ncbi:conserved hypothetical protein [Verticillium alfalfae VaMs.102]|uniref:Uncharacterized protein n=1 Tax=Verticillium alfalfae (strain VaMs.102 / ATCC MYA-4576 / FGSC 10136) TaxID=526221 RepID=C9SBX2_VERA1|nr:conserved hypothetical protein [Verticillium alfalfae VaMs.102]EEY15856.1 conserved hypothetical protein [Verticillium alfalfae VaMs.102]
MSSNQFQPSQGSQKPDTKAPAVAEQPNSSMRSNSSLNPDIAPWTPALVPEGMPTVSQQALHGFHNSYNLHQSEPLNTTEYVGNMQSHTHFGQQVGQEAAIVHNEHQQDAEMVEPLYRTLYDPSGMVIPQENLLDTAGISSTISGIHVPGHIVGLGGPSGFPPPIRPFEPAHGLMNSQPRIGAPDIFDSGGTDRCIDRTGFMGETVHNTGLTSLAGSPLKHSYSSKDGTAGKISLPFPHGFSQPTQRGGLVTSHSAGIIDLDMTPTPIRARSLQSQDTPCTTRSAGLNTIYKVPTGYQAPPASENRITGPQTVGLRGVPAPPPRFNLDSVQGNGSVESVQIPFITTRAEVIAFLGRNSKILNDFEEPVHIIMDRVSSKTNDAYVEFQTMADAVSAVDRFVLNFSKGKVGRLGDRPISVELSSQSSLMKDLFPFASGLRWEGIHPYMTGRRKDGAPYGQFTGFVTEEEMIMLVKHVEMPNRSPFAKECPQRAFECLISTLKKLPWDCHDFITVRQRAAIHRATVELVRILFFKVRNHVDEVNLTSQLLKRLVLSAMTCAGFTPLQKDDIAYIVEMDSMQSRSHGQPRFADSWCHLYALSPKPDVPLDMLEWYIALIREETNRTVAALPIGHRAELERLAGYTDGYFGYMWAEIQRPFGALTDQMTLGACARAEIMAIEQIIRRALDG